MRTLKYNSESTDIQFILKDTHATWHDVADLFFDYLIGSGFILSRSDLAQWYKETDYVSGDDTQGENGAGGEATEREEAEERAGVTGVPDQGTSLVPPGTSCPCRWCSKGVELLSGGD